MANTVITLKKSATSSAVPADLANGELAINYADGKLYYKHANGSIAVFSSAADGFGTVNAAGTLIVADTAGDVLTLESGSGITITGDAINDKITISSTALPNISGATFDGVLKVSNNVSTQGLNVTSNVISFGSAMSILPNGMIMIFGDINMLT